MGSAGPPWGRHGGAERGSQLALLLQPCALTDCFGFSKTRHWGVFLGEKRGTVRKGAGGGGSGGIRGRTGAECGEVTATLILHRGGG